MIAQRTLTQRSLCITSFRSYRLWQQRKMGDTCRTFFKHLHENTSQWSLIHPFTHTFTHQWLAPAMQGTAYHCKQYRFKDGLGWSSFQWSNIFIIAQPDLLPEPRSRPCLYSSSQFFLGGGGANPSCFAVKAGLHPCVQVARETNKYCFSLTKSHLWKVLKLPIN